MATTELETTRGEWQSDWTINVSETDASTAKEIRAAIEDKRHGIEKINMTYLSGGTEWFEILDGTNILIGPIVMASGVPWKEEFDPPIYGTLNTALKIQTQSAVKLNAVIKGVSDDQPISSPSASPSV